MEPFLAQLAAFIGAAFVKPAVDAFTPHLLAFLERQVNRHDVVKDAAPAPDALIEREKAAEANEPPVDAPVVKLT